MDAPLEARDALVRPWRTATLVATLVAAVELVLLLAAVFMLVAKPLSHAMQRHAAAAAFAPVKQPKPVIPKQQPIGLPKLMRSETGVFVLNGNGRNGAASSAAGKLDDLGYRVRATGNAKRQDYASTVVMYRRGFHAEGVRLAHDVHAKVVGPLDGLKPSDLHGAQLAVVLGAR
ncbi:MAG: LytR C-terminal domain-containing protein [Gaiellaceae bacterium]